MPAYALACLRPFRRNRAIGRCVKHANDIYVLRCLSLWRDRLHEDECCDDAIRYGRTGLSPS